MLVVFGRRHVGAVVEDDRVARSERCRHETQFHEGLHADRQEEVTDLIRVEERVKQVVALIHERAHVVAQQAVEAHVPEAEFLMTAAQLRLPVRPQGKLRVPAPDGMLPEMRECSRGLR